MTLVVIVMSCLGRRLGRFGCRRHYLPRRPCLVVLATVVVVAPRRGMGGRQSWL